MADADMSLERDAIDVALVQRLVASQFSKWAQLPIRPVALSGWDNRTFHPGDAMTVRLPSAAGYAAQVEKEHRWLPVLARHLPFDAGTWARGRAWALWKALITAAGQSGINAPEAAWALRTIEAVLADHRRDR